MKSVLGLAFIMALKFISASSANMRRDPYDIRALKKRAGVYKSHAKVLRQINSDKMERCRKRKNLLDIGIFTSTLALTFFSFYGLDKFSSLYSGRFISIDTLQFLYNILILIVLIFTAVQMAARLGEKQIQHFGTVQRLTDFITDIDDLIIIDYISGPEISRKIEDLNQKYKGITSSLPENSDKEWIVAKRHLERKKQEKLKGRKSHLLRVIRRARRRIRNVQ